MSVLPHQGYQANRKSQSELPKRIQLQIQFQYQLSTKQAVLSEQKKYLCFGLLINKITYLLTYLLTYCADNP